MTFGARLVASCVLAFALLGWMGGISYLSVLCVDEDQRRVMRAQIVLEKLDAVLVYLISAETNQRSYTLASDERHLSSYKTDLVDIRDDLNDLGQLTSENPQQWQALQKLRPLVSNEPSEFHENLTPGSKRGTTAVRGGMETRSLLEIMSRVMQMKEEESRLLIRRSQAAQPSSFQMKPVIVFCTILAVLFLAGAAFAIDFETFHETVKQLAQFWSGVNQPSPRAAFQGG